MYCLNPIYIEERGIFPCGMCRKCREMRSNQWAMRMMHERRYHDKAVFVTFTYNDENIPMDFCLHKEDLQKCFKRIRKLLGSRRIKYFACGEYGNKRGRPHYHAIIFGLGNGKEDEILFKKAWDKGFIKLAPVNLRTCKYVTKYVTKAPLGRSKRDIARMVRTPEFQCCSRGIALRFVEENAEELGTRGIYVHGRQVSLPRYYVDKIRKAGMCYQVVADIAADNMSKEIDSRNMLRAEGLTDDQINERRKLLRLQKIEEIKTLDILKGCKDMDDQ